MPHSQLGSLYLDHHGWLVKWLRGKVGNPSDAADLAHDTFLRLLARSPATQPAEPRPFLSTIARGLVVDLWRHRDIEQAYLDALTRLDPIHAPSPEVHHQWLEALLAIDRLLAGLRPRTKAAFMMARLEGLTCPQVAARLGVSLATAERELAKALRQIYHVRYEH